MTTEKAHQYNPSDLYEVREHDEEYLNVGGVIRLVRIYQPEGPGPFPMLLSIHGGRGPTKITPNTRQPAGHWPLPAW